MSTAETLARLHARAFAGQGRGWSVAEFADLIASPLCCLRAGPHGFALARVIAGEAELLTLATDPDYRRQGIAADLLSQIEMAAAERGALTQFLEVAADNAAARALYAGASYIQIGQRAGYYARPAAEAVDALVLTKELGALDQSQAST